MATISVHELSELCRSGQRPEIVDVRSESEFLVGHIAGAKCIPLQQIDLRHADLGDGDLVLVCESATRACMARDRIIASNGRVKVLEGGVRAWRKAGLPLIGSVGTSWSLERQVRLGAGLLILVGVALTLLADKAWILLPTFVGAGLTFAGTTDICMLGRLLTRMPWNRVRRGDVQSGCTR
jgi:rhodanese-related sulfurtransferase